jgi:hypothetical protein
MQAIRNSRHFRKAEYLTDKINGLKIYGKHKNVRELHKSIKELRNCEFPWYFDRLKNHFSHLFIVHLVDVRQKEIHTDHTLVAKCSIPEVQIERENLKIYKSPGTDYIPAQMIYSRQTSTFLYP